MAAFYVLAKGHAEKSYKIAITVSIFGFLLLIVGLTLLITNVSGSPLSSYITIASGIITEIIACIFFLIYNRTTRQMKGFYDGMLTEQNILLSFKLMEDSKDENEKAKIVSQMLTNLINKQNSSSLYANESGRHRRATIK
jgi:hypothetical protein